MYLDPKLSERLSKKWNVPLEVIEKIVKEYKTVDTKRKFIQDILESEWNLDENK